MMPSPKYSGCRRLGLCEVFGLLQGENTFSGSNKALGYELGCKNDLAMSVVLAMTMERGACKSDRATRLFHLYFVGGIRQPW